MIRSRTFRTGLTALLLAAYVFSLAAIVSRAGAAPQVILAEQDFEGGGHPFVGDGSVVGGAYELRGSDAPGVEERNLHFISFGFVPDNVTDVILSFDFVALSESDPLDPVNDASADVLMQFRNGGSAFPSFTHDVTPNGGDDTTFAGDDTNTFFSGTYMVSGNEVEFLGTASIEVHLQSSTDVMRIDNFRIIGIVPEPAMMMLFGIAGGALLMRRSRKSA